MPLTAAQLRDLRRADSSGTGNRLAKAIDLVDVTQAELAAAVGVAQPYVSAVALGKHATITVENAHKFADYFGCAIEDLFPAKQEVA